MKLDLCSYTLLGRRAFVEWKTIVRDSCLVNGKSLLYGLEKDATGYDSFAPFLRSSQADSIGETVYEYKCHVLKKSIKHYCWTHGRNVARHLCQVPKNTHTVVSNYLVKITSIEYNSSCNSFSTDIFSDPFCEIMYAL